MLFFFAVVGLVFSVAAWFDHRDHKVPEFLTVALWLLFAMFATFDTTINLSLAVAVFAFAYAAKFVFSEKPGAFQFGLGWADVLALPVYFAVAMFMPVAILFAALPILVSAIRKKEVAKFPYYSTGLLAQVALTLTPTIFLN